MGEPLCPSCKNPLGRDLITVERRYFRNCGDHDESVRVWSVTCCSTECAVPQLMNDEETG